MSSPDSLDPAAASPAAPGGHELLRTAAPLITLGATYLARKALMKGYESRTGRPAPLIRSRNAGALEKIVWATTMAAVLALVEVVVWKVIGEEDF
jgi:hypothetical protein